MRKQIFLKTRLVFLALVVLSTGTAHALKTWNGVVTNADSAINEGVQMTGDIIITGSVYIHAQGADVAVSQNLTPTADITISGAAGGDSVLYLEADYGRTITFFVKPANITFKGSPGASDNSLLIVVRGGGTVEFDILGGCTLALERNGVGSGVQMYVAMDGTLPATGTILQFIRQPSVSMADETVSVGEDCLIGYMSADSATSTGRIVFDPTVPDSTSRKILSIADKGAVIVSGRYVEDTAATNIWLSDIDRTRLAGCRAVFRIGNNTTPKVPGSLMITNYNDTLGEYLVDPWNNLGARADTTNYKGTFDGIQYGFIVGAQGEIQIGTYAYLDYVGLGLDMCPTTSVGCEKDQYVNPCCDETSCCCANLELLCDLPVGSVIKKRNPSALIIDGSQNPYSNPAHITFSDHSAMFFRSGVDQFGNINGLSDPYPFTINPAYRSPCVGNMVLDVEGQLDVSGTGTDRTNNPSKMEILSLAVNRNGAPVLIGGSERSFPLRNFAKLLGGDYRRYNAAYFFVNNCMTLCDTWLVHSDVNHVVNEKDDTNSEPSYVGGETFKIVPTEMRPTILYSNANLMVHSNIALTGVDQLIPNTLVCGIQDCVEPPAPAPRMSGLDVDKYILQRRVSTTTTSRQMPAKSGPEDKCTLVPTTTCGDNQSTFTFFYNGNKIDSGTGRQMILGTYIGSTSCNGAGVICRDSHLDIMQTTTLGAGCTSQTQSLSLQVEPNNATIVEGLSYPITGQYSIHTPYLGHGSNISIGTEDPTALPFELLTTSSLLVDGSFFSFETRGGPTNSPETSDVTGRGGIFVDTNGFFGVADSLRANMSAMVTKSGNGIINLPLPQVFFDNRVGIAQWNLDLTDPLQRVIVPLGTTQTDYTLNWLATIKDYDNFTPYVIPATPCLSQPATSANIASLPVVAGGLSQLQIKESRLYDPAHVVITGVVRELVFLSGCNSAEAPAGVIILQDAPDHVTGEIHYSGVGLGSTHRNLDSLDASTEFGLDGVTIIANGNGRVRLNEDMVVYNTCHLVAGPDFGATGVQTLRIDSNSDKVLRVRPGAILDLTTFTTENQVVEFGGNIRLILEPGSLIATGGATLRFTDNVVVECETLTESEMPVSQALTDYDTVRVRFVGTGTIQWAGESRMVVKRGALTSVETLPICGIDTTNLTFELRDSAQFRIGAPGIEPFGGSLQIGNVTDSTAGLIDFTLTISGQNALFDIGAQGFLGLSVGLVSKPFAAPDNWVVSELYNVNNISINVNEGTFGHNQVYLGSNQLASLLAIGPVAGVYSYDFTPVTGQLVTNVSQAMVRGGGNIVLVKQPGDITPIVSTDDGSISDEISVGILGSTPLYSDETFTTGDATALYTFMKTDDIAGSIDQPKGRANAGRGLHNQLNIGYIDTLKIGRTSLFDIVGRAGVITSQDYSVNIGAVIATLKSGATYPRAINQIYELQ